MRVLLLASVLSFVTALRAFAQQAPPKIEVGCKISTFGELLLKHNIQLTKPALLRALKSPDAEVRYLSAMKLSEDQAIDAIPAIKEALAAETVPRDQENIALALGLLGDPSGCDELKKMCADENFPPEFRLHALRYMFDLGVGDDGGCLHAAEEIVQLVDSENRSVGNRVSALELLVRFRNLTSEESQRVFALVLNGLNDPEPVVRMGASSALATLGDQDAIPYLKAAIAGEQDENIRSVLETNLTKLQQRRN
jgi:HEAT repeat protein